MKQLGPTDLKPPPGTLSTGWYSVAEGIGFPIWICRGDRPGPLVLLTAGVHGDEYEGPAALHSLQGELEPAKLRGSVIAIPVVNWHAWQQRSRNLQPGDLDLNRCFHAGFTSEEHCVEKLVDSLLSDFIRIADIVMDFHSGGLKLRHLPLAGWYGHDPESEAEALARCFHPEFNPWRIPDVVGVLSHEAHRMGKISLGFECGGGASLDLSGSSAISFGIRRVLSCLRMIEAFGPHIQPDSRQAIRGDYQSTENAGLFCPARNLGEVVKRGQILGEIRTFHNRLVDPVRSRFSGKIAGIAHLPWLRKGDRVAYVG